MGWYADNYDNGNLDGMKRTYFEGKIAPPPFFGCGLLTAPEVQRAVMYATLPEFAPGVYDQRTPGHIPLAKDESFEVTSYEAFERFSNWFQWLRSTWMSGWTPRQDCDNFAEFFMGIMASLHGWGNSARMVLDSYPHPWDNNPAEWHEYNLVLVRQEVDLTAPLLVVAYEPQNGAMRIMGKGDMADYQIRDFSLG